MSTMVPKASLNKNKYLQGIQHIEEVIFALNEFNIEMSIESLLESFDENFFYSFNLSISRLLYKFFKSQMKDISICIQFIKVLNQKEDDMKSNYKIIDIFLHFLLHLKTNESNYFIEMMTEANIIPSNIAKNRSTLFFAHYKTTDEIFGLRPESPLGKYFYDNYEELSKNDWELHKEYVKEGHNPNEFAKIIRNDEVDKLQEITSQINFDFNQTIEPSLYEICSFINKENVSLIDYAAFFGSVKCFKYLLMKNSDLTNTGKYAVAGGNLEIFHLCEQKQISFEGSYEIAIEFHRDEIFQYLYNKKISRIKKFADLGVCSIKHDNNLFISFLESKR